MITELNIRILTRNEYMYIIYLLTWNGYVYSTYHINTERIVLYFHRTKSDDRGTDIIVFINIRILIISTKRLVPISIRVILLLIIICIISLYIASCDKTIHTFN